QGATIGGQRQITVTSINGRRRVRQRQRAARYQAHSAISTIVQQRYGEIIGVLNRYAVPLERHGTVKIILALVQFDRAAASIKTGLSANIQFAALGDIAGGSYVQLAACRGGS